MHEFSPWIKKGVYRQIYFRHFLENTPTSIINMYAKPSFNNFKG